MEECHECRRALAADLGEAAVLCAGGCQRLFHARCAGLPEHDGVAAYLRDERRWRCDDCRDKCAACSAGLAGGAYAAAVACGACGRVFHAACTQLAAATDLRRFLTDRRAWVCDACRGSQGTRRQAPIEATDEGAGREERDDVDAVCRAMLEMEKCLEQFSRKLELFEKDVMSVNGCVRAASEEICKNNAEKERVGEEIEQLTTEVERAVVAVPEEERQASPPKSEAEDAPAKQTVARAATRREKSLSLGGRRRSGQEPRGERVPALYRLTKQFARDHDYRLVWIHHADVFLRKRPGTSARKVKHTADLRAEDATVVADAAQVK